jgi:hypothetical protein
MDRFVMPRWLIVASVVAYVLVFYLFGLKPILSWG